MANNWHCHGAEGENHGLRLVFATEVREQLASYIESGNSELARSELLRLTNDHSQLETNIKAWLLWKELIRLLHKYSTTTIVRGRLQDLHRTMSHVLGDNDNFEHGFWTAVAEVEGLRERVSTDDMKDLRLAHFVNPFSEQQKRQFVDLAEGIFQPMICAVYRSASNDQDWMTSTSADHCDIKANISRAMKFGYPAHHTFKNEMGAKQIDMEVEIITDMCPLMVERDDLADPADPDADADNHDHEEGGAAAATAGADGAVGGVNESPPIPVSEDQREKDDGNNRPDQPPALAGERIMVVICVVNQSQPEQDMMPFRTTVRLLNADGTVMGNHEFYGYRQRDQHDDINVRVYIPRQLAQDNIDGNQGKINVSIDLISIINEVDDGY